MPNSSMSFRRPWLFTNVDSPDVNKVWLAEYMAQHNLTMEVAMEHLAKKMKDFLANANQTIELLEKSDEDLMKECTVFVKEYIPAKDFYSPIPLVEMIKEK